MRHQSLTAEQLRENLSYCPETGVFTWIVRKPRVTYGAVAACPVTNPRQTICVNGHNYSVLQLAWLAIHGRFPRSKLVSRNGNRMDARAENLIERAAKSGRPTAERVRELLSYDPKTGVIHRRVRTSNAVRCDEPAGSRNADGYLVIGVDGTKYAAHRLAWLIVHGHWPAGEIDHINGIRDDNRLTNLRVVDRTGNTQNRANLQKASGRYVGVRQMKTGWQARLQVAKRLVSLGVFQTEREAHAAYLEAKRRLHPTFAG